MGFILATYTDVYFVTEIQVIQWMQNPTATQSLRDFEDWKKDKCQVIQFCQITEFVMFLLRLLVLFFEEFSFPVSKFAL